LAPAVEGDLNELAERVRRLDIAIRAWLTTRGIDLGILESQEDLRRFLEARDPVE
jgi:hypothetical protein